MNPSFLNFIIIVGLVVSIIVGYIVYSTIKFAKSIQKQEHEKERHNKPRYVIR